MKNYFLKHIETFVYGTLSLMFGAAFFFGVLYPSHGISPNAYRVVSQPRSYRQRVLPEEYGRGRIQYSSFLYECLKNS
ncbi:MAG: hypothetical protein E7289_03255 [Lachnospiraceae bacterium]|nr:hypothetical protein [Lachnospiraceae bacterium]